MPEYLYGDSNGHTLPIEHGMNDDVMVICECGLPMHRIPQAARINWNGLRPCEGGVSPVVQQMINDAPRKRDEYRERKEKHAKETEAERRELGATDPTYGTVHHERK